MNMRICVLLLFILCITGSGCKKEYGDIYDPPKDQKGYIYAQLAANPKLSVFVSAIDRVPKLKDELEASGLFTIMAPGNDAFARYFESQPLYKSIADIPEAQLSDMIRYHILRYMLFQVNFLNPGVTKVNFDIFKYESRLVTTYKDKLSNGRLRSIYYTPKQLQVYTPFYFTSNAVSPADYKAIYGDEAEISGDIKLNVMGASVIEADIAAGNGAIHIINKVLVPALNVAQELDTNPEYAGYNQFLKQRFMIYAYNQAATRAQGNNGDIDGDGVVDSLWNRQYSINAIMDNENAVTTTSALSMTAFIPSKDAFTSYMNNRFSSFSSLDFIPSNTFTLLYNSHFTNSLDWPSKVAAGRANSVGGDKISISNAEINSIRMASNGLFYELNKVIEPAAFTTVTGPTFFSPSYTYFSEMLSRSGLLPVLTNAGINYTLFSPTNEALIAAGITYTTTGANPSFMRTRTGTGPTEMSNSEIATVVGNNILLNSYSVSDLTDGFYETKNGSFVAIKGKKIEGAVRGSEASIVNPDIKRSNGYFHGVDKVTLNPLLSINELVNLSVAPNPVPLSYQKFRELCVLAGVDSKDFINITSADANKKFTLFVPSNEAIIAAQLADQLPRTGAQGNTVLDVVGKGRLFNYIKYFFVAQQQIFTDGKVTGAFQTSKTNAAGNNLLLNVGYNGGTLTVTDTNGAEGRVLLNNPGNYPQNVIARDGVIQVINNAFISQY